jgi:hypothetical protein
MPSTLKLTRNFEPRPALVGRYGSKTAMGALAALQRWGIEKKMDCGVIKVVGAAVQLAFV